MSEVGLCGTLFSVNFWAYYYVVTLKLSLLISVLGHFDQKLQKNFMTMDILEYTSTICHAKKMFEIGLLSLTKKCLDAKLSMHSYCIYINSNVALEE